MYENALLVEIDGCMENSQKQATGGNDNLAQKKPHGCITANHVAYERLLLSLRRRESIVFRGVSVPVFCRHSFGVFLDVFLVTIHFQKLNRMKTVFP